MEIHEIRVTKITGPTRDTVYLARPPTTPDPGPVITAFSQRLKTDETATSVWEVQITRITVAADQSQLFEPTFLQRIEAAPDLGPIIAAYGESILTPTPSVPMAPTLS
jgi:hypothetical protein